jgi:hypothetical protein
MFSFLANETKQIFILAHTPNYARNESVRLSTDIDLVFRNEKEPIREKRVKWRAEVAAVECHRSPFAMNPRCDTPVILGMLVVVDSIIYVVVYILLFYFSLNFVL